MWQKLLIWITLSLLGILSVRAQADKTVGSEVGKSDSLIVHKVRRLSLDVSGTFNMFAAGNVNQGVRPAGSMTFRFSKQFTNFMLESGLRWNWRDYNLRGFNIEYAPQITRLKWNSHSLKMPFYFGWIESDRLFGHEFTGTVKFGTYFACGLSGTGMLYRYDKEGWLSVVDIDNIYKDKEGFEAFRRFDVGMHLEWEIYLDNKWKFGISYTKGWRNIHPTYDNRMKNEMISLSFGYIFDFKDFGIKRIPVD